MRVDFCGSGRKHIFKCSDWNSGKIRNGAFFFLIRDLTEFFLSVIKKKNLYIFLIGKISEGFSCSENFSKSGTSNQIQMTQR